MNTYVMWICPACGDASECEPGEECEVCCEGTIECVQVVPLAEAERLREENARQRKAFDRLESSLCHVINRVSTEGRDDEHGHIFLVGKAAIEWAQHDLDGTPGGSGADREQPPTKAASSGVALRTGRTLPFYWQRIAACSVYDELHCLGDYGVRRNPDADEDDRGGHVAWEVWHWPSGTVESDWFNARDAYRECVRLHREAS